jgi:choline dehydrogenase-like flavoprotein
MAIQDHAVLIIGSGHAGGMAAYVLAQKGIRCLMLNAGPPVDLARDRRSVPGYEMTYRGLMEPGAVGDGAIGENVLSAFVHPSEVPYTHDADKPYVWVRNRVLGGRSVFWSRQSFRLSDFEFKAKDHDGYGENWPIAHADLAPYYERVEQMYRVTGRPEGLPQFPDSKFTTINETPDSDYLKQVMAAAEPRGITISKGRQSLGIDGLASSVNLMLPDALASGNLTIVPNAIVRELTVDKNTGRVNGAHFIDRHSRRELHVQAKVIVLAAGCLESTRLLLNSGLANSSGVLGRYLFDQYYGGTAIALIPDAVGRARRETARPGFGGGIIAPFRNVTTREKSFIRRYVVNLNVGANPTPDVLATYGADLETKMADYAGAIAQGGLMGEVLPRYENHVRINKDVKDIYGIPVLHVSCAYTDNERNMHQDAQDSMAELFEASGFKLLAKNPNHREPGQSVHELGTCRMGDNPKTSVLNKWNQSHDIPNLLVVDGSAFVTGGWQNPTLTISAVSMRAADHLAELMRRGDL